MKSIALKKIKKSTSLSIGQILTLVALIIFGFVVQIYALIIHSTSLKEKEIDAARLYGESVASGISVTLNQSVNTSEVIKDLYLEFGDMFINDFCRICQRLVEGNAAVGSMYVAPDAIIRCAYPKEAEASTIGFEMLRDPEQAEMAYLALDSRRPTVAGPHRLVEGGTGFIIRNPVFKDDAFKAFSIVVLEWDSFVNQVLQTVSQRNSGYKFGVWKNDSHAVVDENGFIFKNCDGNVSRLVDIEIYVPNDVWHLVVEPERGWFSVATILPEIIISLVFILAMDIFIYYRQREHAKKLYQANHDDLTGLLQRTAFLKRVKRIFKENPNERFSIIAADIKDFKVCNSLYGAEKCDQILVYLAKSFQKINSNGICSRYGGDQFVSIFPMPDVKPDTNLLLENAIQIAKNAPVPNLNIKYGVYENVDTSIPVIQACDRALLAARSILNRYDAIFSNYEGSVSRKNMRRQELESEFLDAIDNKDFKIWYQPKFDATTEEMVGSEALVRWIKSDGSIVSPADFIGIFEEDGLIYRLDMYVFRQVCERMKYWQNRGKRIVPVSVNVSRVTLQHDNIVQKYKDIVDEFEIDQQLVPLEITESASADAKETQRLANEFKEAGFMIHMDDFGSGFSSLGNLNSMPFDEIKLDKSLVDYIGTPGGDELLKHTLSLVKFKGLKTIAEGVETKEQLEFLRNLGCDHIQGYYFSPPLSYEKFLEFLKTKLDGNI